MKCFIQAQSGGVQCGASPLPPSLPLSRGLVFQPMCNSRAQGHAPPAPLNNWHLYEVLTTNISHNSAVAGPQSFMRVWRHMARGTGFSCSHGPHIIHQIQLCNYYFNFPISISSDWLDLKGYRTGCGQLLTLFSDMDTVYGFWSCFMPC